MLHITYRLDPRSPTINTKRGRASSLDYVKPSYIYHTKPKGGMTIGYS